MFHVEHSQKGLAFLGAFVHSVVKDFVGVRERAQ